MPPAVKVWAIGLKDYIEIRTAVRRPRAFKSSIRMPVEVPAKAVVYVEGLDWHLIEEKSGKRKIHTFTSTCHLGGSVIGCFHRRFCTYALGRSVPKGICIEVTGLPATWLANHSEWVKRGIR